MSRRTQIVALLACAAGALPVLAACGAGQPQAADQSLMAKQAGPRTTLPVSSVGMAPGSANSTDQRNAICDLLPASTVNLAFGISGVTAKSSYASDTDNDCDYSQPTTNFLLSADLSKEAYSEPASQLVNAVLKDDCSNKQQLTGVGDAAAYCQSSDDQQTVYGAKKVGDNMYTLDLIVTTGDNKNVKDPLSKLAKAAMDSLTS